MVGLLAASSGVIEQPMRQLTHTLSGSNSGTQRSLISLHYGTPGAGPKVVLQTALHADELPGMVVLHHLRARLQTLETQGQVLGEVVLIPTANPIGLDQHLLYNASGRFELNTGENFNRGYPDFAAIVGDQVAAQLNSDAEHNRRVIRQAMREYLSACQPTTELESLRVVLMHLAHDADVALDLHCDYEAAMHLYVEEPYLQQAQALWQHLGAQAVLWAKGAASSLCYDEALSGVWWRLAERFSDLPIPLACLSATVELRGQADVGGDWARRDAQAIEQYLVHCGALAGTASEPPPALCQPTPLAGSQSLEAPHAGVVDYQVTVGERVNPQDVIAWVIDPISDQRSAVRAEVPGVLYARHVARWATTGMNLGKIAGPTAFKTGPLLGP